MNNGRHYTIASRERKLNTLERWKSATKDFMELDLEHMSINYKLVVLFISDT